MRMPFRNTPKALGIPQSRAVCCVRRHPPIAVAHQTRFEIAVAQRRQPRIGPVEKWRRAQSLGLRFGEESQWLGAERTKWIGAKWTKSFSAKWPQWIGAQS